MWNELRILQKVSTLEFRINEPIRPNIQNYTFIPTYTFIHFCQMYITNFLTGKWIARKAVAKGC